MALTLAAVVTVAAWAGSCICFYEHVYDAGFVTCTLHCGGWFCQSSTPSWYLLAQGRYGDCHISYSEWITPYTSDELDEEERVDLSYRSYGYMRFTSYDRDHPRDELLAANVTAVSLPLWSIIILFGTYPTTAFIRGPLRRWRRRRTGLCVKCTYDLTGNVSGVCPECGEAACAAHV